MRFNADSVRKLQSGLLPLLHPLLGDLPKFLVSSREVGERGPQHRVALLKLLRLLPLPARPIRGRRHHFLASESLWASSLGHQVPLVQAGETERPRQEATAPRLPHLFQHYLLDHKSKQTAARMALKLSPLKSQLEEHMSRQA